MKTRYMEAELVAAAGLMHRQTDRQTDRRRNGQKDRKTNKHKNKQVDRQTRNSESLFAIL